MWDLAIDKNLKNQLKILLRQKIITTIYYVPTGLLLLSLLLQATDKDGNSILKDKKVTRFTNNEVAAQLDKVVPFLLEDRMKGLGGKFKEGENLTLCCI